MTIDSVRDIPSSRQDLDCFSGIYASRAEVFRPRTVDELRRVFAHAGQAERRVTLRAGGHCFDSQALGDDLVISLERLDQIEVLEGEKKIRVGPGATWGAILARLEPLGLVPAVTVTTANATAGGTLSGDCLSRFSPAYGKEGTRIESFELLTPEGELLVCKPPPDGDPRTLEERAYFGVIGGLGYLGAVVSITYRVLSIRNAPGRIGVRTVVRKRRTFEGLSKELIPATRKMVEEHSDPDDGSKFDGIYSALYRGRWGRPYTFMFTSAFTPDERRKRMPLHQPASKLRIAAEWLMRLRVLNPLLWRVYFHFCYRNEQEFIDDLADYSFFMDGNVRAKRIAREFGFHLKMVQQTFVVPSDPGAAGGWDKARDDLVEWLEFADDFLRARKLRATLTDVLFLPRDLPFLLSAGAELAGFAVTYAFEVSKDDQITRVKQAFSELAEVLSGEKFGGRIYLVKNVCAEKQTLAKMYGENAAAFLRLKGELDPHGLLRNEFLEKTFGGPTPG